MAAIEVADVETAQRHFVEVLPDIERIAGRAFDDLNPEARQEAMAEAVALAWKNHLHCTAEDKGVKPSSLAYYAVKGVRNGRTFCGQNATDVLAPRAQVLGRVRVESLCEAPATHTGYDDGSAWWNCTEGLVDRRIWEHPPERVRIKLDYSAFLRQPEVTPQEREVFRLVALGCGTGEIACKLGISAPRICQLKRAIAGKLTDFFGPDIGPSRCAQRKARETASQAR